MLLVNAHYDRRVEAHRYFLRTLADASSLCLCFENKHARTHTRTQSYTRRKMPFLYLHKKRCKIRQFCLLIARTFTPALVTFMFQQLLTQSAPILAAKNPIENVVFFQFWINIRLCTSNENCLCVCTRVCVSRCVLYAKKNNAIGNQNNPTFWSFSHKFSLFFSTLWCTRGTFNVFCQFCGL